MAITDLTARRPPTPTAPPAPAHDVDQVPAADPTSTPPATPARQTTPAGPAARTLTQAQTAALSAIVVGALAVAAIGLYLSFSYVAAFAHEHLGFSTLAHGQLFALGLDAAILVLIGIDLVLAWLRHPVSWIRYPVWALTAATVVINAASVLPDGTGATRDSLDYLAAAAHGLVPLLFVIIVEVGRHVIDRIVRPRTARQTIPAHRWILAPWPTWRLYRRMRLWEIGYTEILHRDADLRAYLIWLDRECDRRGKPATADELLPKSLAPYGVTVADALALPDKQEREAHERDTARRRRALALETTRVTDQLAADTEREAAQADLEVARAQSAGRIAEARTKSDAQATAAERAAQAAADLEETTELRLARARDARAIRDEADATRESENARRAAEDAKRAADEATLAADRVARERAEERQKIADATRATALANRETEDANRAAADARRAAAEAEIAAVEAEAVARLTPVKRAVRWSMREIESRATAATGQRPTPQEAVEHMKLLPYTEIESRWTVSGSAAGKYRKRAEAMFAAGATGHGDIAEWTAAWKATEKADEKADDA
ncbi:DUF2637 domain-containing protein [Streptomyces sp. SM14]|uniref:DUF2637 domain-containing protein n=1 Tax=Streptomyces sp. SM14 TaxID=1736045 RepID=UPI000CD4E514|nr:DUF2637 domain-containing protein [Streptomyces sp. SM14]